MRYAIGLPSHCETSASKLNRTICPSCCPVIAGHDTSKVNQVSDLAEVPVILDGIDTIETSTVIKPQKTTTTKLLPVDPSTTLGDNFNQSMVEQTTAKDKIDTSSQGPSAMVEKNNNKVNKATVHSEQPVELRDLSMMIPITPSPIVQIANDSDTVDIIRTRDVKPSDIEPIIFPVADSSEPTIYNDIKSPLNKKPEIKMDKPLTDDGAEATKSTMATIEPLTSFTPSTQTTTATPATKDCLLINLHIRSDSFNITLGYDEICSNFNITYNIPLSKYMKENRFELVFE